MQNPAAFDLNRAIKSWREQTSRLPSFRAENVDELESHLRESVNRLKGLGLSEEEAWIIAQKRLGIRTELELEFGKINEPVRTGRAVTSMMISIIAAAVLLPVSGHPFWLVYPVWGNYMALISALTVLTFLVVVLPAFALMREWKWEVPGWLAMVAGLTLGSGVALLVAFLKAWEGVGIAWPALVMGGAAGALGVFTYARFRLTERTQPMVKGAWLAMAGAALCGVVVTLFQNRVDLLHGYWLDRWLAPPLALFGYPIAAGWIIFPAGAWLGWWLPRRVQSWRAWSSFGLGCGAGAALSALMLLVGLTLWRLYLAHCGQNDAMIAALGGVTKAAMQEHLMRTNEVWMQQYWTRFAVVVPTAALWVGLWAVRARKQARAELAPA